MEVKLLVVGGDAEAAEIQLELPTVIGRGRDSSVTLPHPLVSRRHCELFERDGKLFVRDLGSLNGTYVNNQRIEEPCELPPGELLTVGNMTFRAVYGQPEEPAPQPEEPAAQPEPPRGSLETTAAAPTARPTDTTQHAVPSEPPAASNSADDDTDQLDDPALNAFLKKIQ